MQASSEGKTVKPWEVVLRVGPWLALGDWQAGGNVWVNNVFGDPKVYRCPLSDGIYSEAI